MNILEVKNLIKHFPISHGFLSRSKKKVHAVNGVSFELKSGETLGVVGESGCGKSTLAMLLLRLLEADQGEIIFDGKNVTQLSQKAFRVYRSKIQMIFQDPYASLNPRMTAGEIIEEPLIIHRRGDALGRRRRVLELLDLVGLRTSDFEKYPHEFSGGQRQRIGIARAIALNPSLIVADEPVSALDVSIQGEILNLLKNLQQQLGLTYIFISHDLKAVSQISDRIAVMYLGKIVELFDTEALAHVKHPYTQALLSAVLLPNPLHKRERIKLEGDVPSPIQLPSGCSFHPRCLYKESICFENEPILKPQGTAHHPAACHFTNKVPQEIELD